MGRAGNPSELDVLRRDVVIGKPSARRDYIYGARRTGRPAGTTLLDQAAWGYERGFNVYFTSSDGVTRTPLRHGDLFLAGGLTDDEIAAEKQRWIEHGCAEDEAEDYVAPLRAAQKRVDYFYFEEDELFTTRDVVKFVMLELRKFHQTNKEPVTGFGFERFMKNVWGRQGHEVVLPISTNAGEDWRVLPRDEIAREQENSWILISAKSENRAKPGKRIDITSLAPHHVDPIEVAEHCVQATKAAVDHLSRYQRMIYLRSLTGEHFPGKLDMPAHRYVFLEVPKDDMAERLDALTEADFLAKFKANEIPLRSTFNLSIMRGKERLFSITISRDGHVRIYGIMTDGYCRQLATYFTEPLPADRNHQANTKLIEKP